MNLSILNSKWQLAVVLLSVMLSLIVVWAAVNGATTINANISTDGDLTVIGNTFLYGNFGLGTTTPAKLLSVQGDGLFSGTLSVANLIATGTIKFNGVSYALPSSDGTNGQVLSTNGSGVLSWTTAGGGSSGAWTIVSNQVLATPSSFFDFTGLNLDTDKVYKILVIGFVETGTSGLTRIKLFYNGDLVESNYTVTTTNASETAEAFTGYTSRLASLDITIGKAEKVSAFGILGPSGGVEPRSFQHSWNNMVSNVTSIRLAASDFTDASESKNFLTGSRFILMKLN